MTAGPTSKDSVSSAAEVLDAQGGYLWIMTTPLIWYEAYYVGPVTMTWVTPAIS